MVTSSLKVTKAREDKVRQFRKGVQWGGPYDVLPRELKRTPGEGVLKSFGSPSSNRDSFLFVHVGGMQIVKWEFAGWITVR